MKKVKTNKLNLNKQTVTNLVHVKGGKFATSACSDCAPSCRGTCAISCDGSCQYTCNASDACPTGASKCYCG